MQPLHATTKLRYGRNCDNGLLRKLLCFYKCVMYSNKFEVIICYLFWIGSVFYGIYGVYNVKKEFKYIDDIYNDFENGWWDKSSKKDVSDFEWQTMLSIFKQLYPWLILHMIVSEFIRSTDVRVLPYWHCIIGTAFITNTMGIIGLLLVIAQPVFFYCISKLNKKYYIWICNLICLVLILYFKSLCNSKNYYVMKYSEMQHYIIMLTISWVNLRCLSFSIDNLSKTKLLHLLSYCFYLPTLCIGPFIQFQHLKRSYAAHAIDLPKRTFKLLISFIRFGFWLLFIEFCLHFVYVSALSYQIQLVRNLSSSALYGYGYCMGQLFHLKYVVFYGLSTSIAKFEDVKAPATPKCIGRIHLYSDMWKHFDAGLYQFLLNYIYFPTVGNFTILRRLFSSMLCFSFVYIWHGIEYHILTWAFVNYLGICVEQMIKSLSTLSFIQCLQEGWKQRLLCAVYSPLLAISAISNFYFFAGTDIGNIFVERIFQSKYFPLKRIRD
ncbi:hypothetical protein RN001_000609 [Aquatica leii]|uniref:Protein-cysteine N-palmitoyltransferase Rasp n=1 Tax=Aquatica leii TaxID=1421715 RepID=A0AAN7SQL4_9COLE|nr:hypothetical protein RN001_000609 [Aquatica leii]